MNHKPANTYLLFSIFRPFTRCLFPFELFNLHPLSPANFAVKKDLITLHDLPGLHGKKIRVICGQIDFSKTNPIFRVFIVKTRIATNIKANQTHRPAHSYTRMLSHPSTPANFAVKKDLITLHDLHDLHGKKIRVICRQIDFSKTKPIFRVSSEETMIAPRNKANQTRTLTPHVSSLWTLLRKRTQFRVFALLHTEQLPCKNVRNIVVLLRNRR